MAERLDRGALHLGRFAAVCQRADETERVGARHVLEKRNRGEPRRRRPCGIAQRGGGGRSGAAGIDFLADAEFARFTSAFAQAFDQTA